MSASSACGASSTPPVACLDTSQLSVADFLRSIGDVGSACDSTPSVSDVRVIARPAALAEAAAIIAAAANTTAFELPQPRQILLLSCATPLAGWSGKEVADEVEKWARHECAANQFWKLHPPPALVEDLPGVAAVDGCITFSVHIFTCGSLVQVPPVRDTLERDPHARFVLMLRVRPSQVLALLINSKSSGSAAGQWRRAEIGVAAAAGFTPDTAAVCLTCERTSAATTTPLQPRQVRDAITVASQWISEGLPGAQIAFATPPVEYACDARFVSELASSDWKSVSTWQDDSTAPPWQRRQDDAILYKALEYATSFLSLPGGGQLVLGVNDKAPSAGGIEGIISAPAALGNATHAEKLEEQLRRILRAAVVPWCDDWLRIVAVPVRLDASHLLAAAAVLEADGDGAAVDSVLVVEFAKEKDVVRLRRACKSGAPCASLPLPLLIAATGTLPETITESKCVFRLPQAPEEAIALISHLKTANASGHVTLTRVSRAVVQAQLPDLHVLHVQFSGAAAGRAVCSPLDVVAPILIPGSSVFRYLPWQDIISFLQWERPTFMAALVAQLSSPAHRIHCWNVSSAPSSRALFIELRSSSLAASWMCADLTGTPPAEWGAADLLSDQGSADTLILLLCEPHADAVADQAWRDDLCAAFRFSDGPSLLLAAASSRRIVAVSSSATHAASALGTAATTAHHSAASAALRAASVVPPATVIRSSRLVPVVMPPAPASAAHVKEAAKRLLRGESLPPAQMLQLLKLPADSCAVFERGERDTVQAVLSREVDVASRRGSVQYVQLARQHVAAGAALLAMRCLVNCGCDPMLVADAAVGDLLSVQQWATTLPPSAVLAVVLHQPPAAASRWLASAVLGRAAVVVCVVNKVDVDAASFGASLSVPVVSGQLSTRIELDGAVAACLRFFPERRSALENFSNHAHQQPPQSIQRSLAALAVAAHMDSFVPLNVVLNYFFSSPPPPVGVLPAARWLVMASLFHAFDVSVSSGRQRMAVALREAMRPTHGWHLVGYVPRNMLPVTVHVHFAASILRRAAVALCPGSSSALDKLLQLLRQCLSDTIALDDDAMSEGTQSAWFAAVQARPHGARFSNIVGAVFRAARPRNAASLLDTVRQALTPTRHASQGAHLLVTLSRVWRHAALDGVGTLSNGEMHEYLQSALGYAILAVHHWGAPNACTCTLRDVTVNPRQVRERATAALSDHPANAQVALHNLAVVVVETGIRLGWLQHDNRWQETAEPPAYVALALQLLLQLRTADTDSRERIDNRASDALLRLRGYVQHPNVRPSHLAPLSKAYALWSTTLKGLPGTFEDYLAVLPATAEADGAASAAAGGGSSHGSFHRSASGLLPPAAASAPDWVAIEENYARLLMDPRDTSTASEDHDAAAAGDVADADW